MRANEYMLRPNTLYHSDCLEVMQHWEQTHGECIDLIYLDPPFNSKANYSILYGKDQTGKPLSEQAQFVAFKDTWYWGAEAEERVERLSRVNKTVEGLALFLGESGMLAYLSYMAERLGVMHRILKPTGSLYLHCDPTASHYLKTVLDSIFGAKNYRNEITWRRSSVKGTRGQTKTFGSVTDIIFLYAKSKSGNVVIPKMHPDEMPKFPYVDEQGEYRAVTPLYGDASLHKCATFAWKKHNPVHGWRVSYSNLEKMNKEDRIHYMKSGKPYRKQYREEYEGVSVSNLWTDIPIASRKERTGYKTQKPLALLDRIINASSNKGDLVLDPFCGCGTTAEASWKLKRKFLGIDISPYAVTRVCKERLKSATGVQIRGLPTDMQSATDLAKANPFVFEHWAISCLQGFMPNTTQVADGGIDGRGWLLDKPVDKEGKELSRACIAQVKGGTVSVDSIKALVSQIIGGKAGIGVMVTLNKHSQTKTVRQAIVDAGTCKRPDAVRGFNRLLFWSIEEYFATIEPKLPAMAHPYTGKRMAPQEVPVG